MVSIKILCNYCGHENETELFNMSYVDNIRCEKCHGRELKITKKAESCNPYGYDEWYFKKDDEPKKETETISHDELAKIFSFD